MGKPGMGKLMSSGYEYIVVGSEPGEVKHLSTRRKRNQNEIPQVAASERGLGQTIGIRTYGVVGRSYGILRC